MAKINQHKAGVLLSYVNLGLGTIIPLFYTPIMLSLLGQSEYGLYSLAHSVTAYLSLLNLGMGTAISRYLARYRAEGDLEGTRRLLGLFITLYTCASLIVCIAGGCLAFFGDRIFGTGLTTGELDRMKILVIIMTVSVALSLPTSTFTAVISAYERFAFIKTLGIVETVLIPVLNLLVLYLGNGSVGMVLVGLSVQIISSVIYIAYCAKSLHITPRFRNMPTNLLRELVGFCAFVVLSTLVDMLYWSTDKVLIGAVLGTAAVAVYNIGGVFTAILQNLAQAIGQVFIPRVMMMASKGKRSVEEVSELMIRVGRIQFYIVSFILSGYTVFGQRFIRLWAGVDYSDAYYVALFTMVPLAVPLIQSIAFSYILAQNKHQFRAIVYTIIAILNVISTYLVLPYYGIIGAALCTAVAFILGTGIIINIYYHRVMKLDVIGFWKNILKIAVLPTVMAIGSWFVVNRLLTENSIGVFLVGVLVYSVVFWLLTWFVSFNEYEKKLFLGMIKR